MVVGSEPPFSVSVEVISRTDIMEDRDVNPANNVQQVMFAVDAMADLSVEGL